MHIINNNNSNHIVIVVGYLHTHTWFVLGPFVLASSHQHQWGHDSYCTSWKLQPYSVGLSGFLCVGRCWLHCCPVTLGLSLQCQSEVPSGSSQMVDFHSSLKSSSNHCVSWSRFQDPCPVPMETCFHLPPNNIRVTLIGFYCNLSVYKAYIPLDVGSFKYLFHNWFILGLQIMFAV